jgi:hypothetical protein
MERRLSQRRFVDLTVFVVQPGRPAVRCPVSDISETGLFLKTDTLYFPRYEQLNLVFALHIKSSNVVRMRQVPAMVARSHADGLGMVFCRNRRGRTA